MTIKHFTNTSDQLYDKHLYKLVYKDNTSIIVDNYYDLYLEWNSQELKNECMYIEILDKNKKPTKGFK